MLRRGFSCLPRWGIGRQEGLPERVMEAKAITAMVNVSGGMTLTLTNFQMKLFTSIAAVAAVIGT